MHIIERTGRLKAGNRADSSDASQLETDTALHVQRVLGRVSFTDECLNAESLLVCMASEQHFDQRYKFINVPYITSQHYLSKEKLQTNSTSTCI